MKTLLFRSHEKRSISGCSFISSDITSSNIKKAFFCGKKEKAVLIETCIGSQLYLIFFFL